METTDSPLQPPRRHFLIGLAVMGLSALVKLMPVAGGLVVYLQPLRRRAVAAEYQPVASLAALPADGTPRKFSIFADRVDAWNRIPNVAIGTVYLRRTGPAAAQALHATCPHAGCFVRYRADERDFVCPCHASQFALDGTISSPNSPSPRGLDALAVQVRPDGQVLVKFQNFRPGVPEKVSAS